jgi:hypothetical protein
MLDDGHGQYLARLTSEFIRDEFRNISIRTQARERLFIASWFLIWRASVGRIGGPNSSSIGYNANDNPQFVKTFVIADVMPITCDPITLLPTSNFASLRKTADFADRKHLHHSLKGNLLECKP